MISRRDKILTRPWQEKRFENHRRKVKSALPVIDNRTPAHGSHVLIKLKQQQSELERIATIERDNLTLLRRMAHIKRNTHNRNYWNTPPPSFLGRVPLYNIKYKEVLIEPEVIIANAGHIRKSKCSACVPHTYKSENLPEERVPWDPPKPTINRKRSKSVPIRPTSLSSITEKTSSNTSDKYQNEERSKSCNVKNQSHRKAKMYHEECTKHPQGIILNRGSLRLALNFPSDTVVKLREGGSERLIFGPECSCKSFRDVEI